MSIYLITPVNLVCYQPLAIKFCTNNRTYKCYFTTLCCRCNYIGFNIRITRQNGLRTDTVSVEDSLSYFFPKFNPDKYKEILETFSERERNLIINPLTSKKGTVLKFLTRFRGGSVTDVRVVIDEDGTGKQQLKSRSDPKTKQ